MIKLIFSLMIFASAHGICTDFVPLVGLKAGYFFFSDSKMRKIYDRGGLDIQLTAEYPLWSLTDHWTLDVYGAVEYFHRSGKSLHAHQKTAIWSVPINFGIKPIYTIDSNKQYYCAFGPRYFYIHQHNRSDYLYKNQSKNALGFFINTGFDYAPCECLMINSFLEYSYGKIRFHSRESSIYTKNAQIGGFTLGGGIGYVF